MLAFATLLSAVLLARGANAQLITSTYPWANGDTVIMSPSTNPINGLVTTVVVSTLTGGAAGVVTTPLTTALTTTTNTRLRTTTTVPTTTATQRVVGQETSYPPMRTTTYGYDPGNGQGWISATWTASVTADPTAATAIVPAGTIIDYNAYQSVINAQLYSSAVAADAVIASNGTVSVKSGAERLRTPWTAAALAIGGAAVGAMMI